MPNVGRPSRGCQACKDRKVKVLLRSFTLRIQALTSTQCDLSLPSCRRCIRNRRVCPGYPTPTDLTFRNTLSTDIQGCYRHSSVSFGASPFGPVSTDWRAEAISLFFHDYVISPSESTIGFGFLQCLPTIWNKKGPETLAYREAVSAVALTSFAHRSSLDYLIVQARQRYGKALQLAHGSLQSNQEVTTDTTLATVLCLGFYETISGDRPPWASEWSSHIDILEHLLHVRRLAPPDEVGSRQLSCNAHVYLQMRNLSKRIRPSEEAELIVNDPRQEANIRRSGNLVCKVCHFLADANGVLQAAPTIDSESAGKISDLLRKGSELDHKLQQWGEQVSGKYRITVLETAPCSPPSLSSGTQQQRSVHIYSSASMACLWNLWRCTRIVLLRCLQQLIVRAQHGEMAPIRTSSPADEDQASKLPSLFSDICASVPYLLGEVDQNGRLHYPNRCKAVGGFLLLWPLKMMLALGPTDEAQKDWIKKRLNFIGFALGIQQALEPAGHSTVYRPT